MVLEDPFWLLHFFPSTHLPTRPQRFLPIQMTGGLVSAQSYVLRAPPPPPDGPRFLSECTLHSTLRRHDRVVFTTSNMVDSISADGRGICPAECVSQAHNRRALTPVIPNTRVCKIRRPNTQSVVCVYDSCTHLTCVKPHLPQEWLS